MKALCGIVRSVRLPETKDWSLHVTQGRWMHRGAGCPGQSESGPSQAFAVVPVGDRQSRPFIVDKCH